MAHNCCSTMVAAARVIVCPSACLSVRPCASDSCECLCPATSERSSPAKPPTYLLLAGATKHTDREQSWNGHLYERVRPQALRSIAALQWNAMLCNYRINFDAGFSPTEFFSVLSYSFSAGRSVVSYLYCICVPVVPVAGGGGFSSGHNGAKRQTRSQPN